MYSFRFSAYRLVEFPNSALYQVQIGKWMEIREAENNYLLARLSWIVARANSGAKVGERFFALKDGDAVVAAGIVFPTGCFCHTWAAHDMVAPIVEGLIAARCRLTELFGPAHVSWQLGQRYAERTGQELEAGRAERVYQLSRLSCLPPQDGRLELATVKDVPMLLPWMKEFMRETAFEAPAGEHVNLVGQLIEKQSLYLWKSPEAVSMAAWTAPTARGGAINFVYTPAERRRKGYARAVVTALAQRMLSAGAAHCLILTDTKDERTNLLYPSVGARAMCELERCVVVPKRLQVALRTEPVHVGLTTN